LARVLIAAYACEPGQGSEPAVGWNWAQEAVRAGHEVWVITRENNRQAIEFEGTTRSGPGPRFVYLDLPAPFLRLKRRGGHPALLAYYYAWQIAVAFTARRLHRELRLDVAHHVTFVNDSLPSGLALLPIPFIWGPVGGSTHQLPETISLNLPPYARRHELARARIQSAFRRFDPFLSFTRRRASLILVYTTEALEALSPSERRRARAVVHIGVTDSEPPHRPVSHAAPQPGERLHVLTGGRLVHWKGLDLLVEGFSEFAQTRPEVDARLTVTGTGRFRSELEKIAAARGVTEKIVFTGRLGHRDDVFRLMEDADMYALPTLRDGPPVAILEAMAFGLPVLCLDIGATAELVPDHAGLKIAPDSRGSVIKDIGRNCAWVADNPGAARELGNAARSHVLLHHDWSRIRETISRAYDDVLGD
jgi:glycosyltransferase involved in cell wall biosynthesis